MTSNGRTVHIKRAAEHVEKNKFIDTCEACPVRVKHEAKNVN